MTRRLDVDMTAASFSDSPERDHCLKEVKPEAGGENNRLKLWQTFI